MERYLCIHGHFYQPPRENPWLEAIELQDSAYPYHDWNERITAECYAPNAASRILGAGDRIERIVNNYSQVSFNFGPTLLAWLSSKAPEVYRAILDADSQSRERFSGHGSALAQAYNHIILPLANRRDKYTQLAWGIQDFEHHFGRKPEGMWLPETAVDLETLDILSELGMQFTIVAPYQALRIRPIGELDWQDVSGGRIDPRMPYLLSLPSGRSVILFFYDGPVSRAVAFERLLANGEDFARRLLGAFSNEAGQHQLVHIATDGETYGHHFWHGEMGLAYALHYITSGNLARLTNYGEFLEKHPCTQEVEISENTSWSCAHGIERWRNDCGCNSGAHPGWNQAWRAPLRQALDWLRDSLAPAYESRASRIFQDPWKARDDYIRVILDRSPACVERFLKEHARARLTEARMITALKLLELQRHAMLMYTSCGWFFDELSGIETVQVIQYAGRAIQLAEEVFGYKHETQFLERLERARSNVPEHDNGRKIYEKSVRPAMIDLKKLGAHYGITSLFEDYTKSSKVYCYTVDREDYQTLEVRRARLALGRARFTSDITRESATLSFGVLLFGEHNVNGGVCEFRGEEAYQTTVQELSGAFFMTDFPLVIRVLDRNFGGSTYSIRSLFRDEQRKVLDQILASSLSKVEDHFRQVYERRVPLMRFLTDLGNPLPKAFHAAAEFTINSDLLRAFRSDKLDPRRIRNLLSEAAGMRVTLDATTLEYALRSTLERMIRRLAGNPSDLGLLEELSVAINLTASLPFEMNLWTVQNIYYGMLQSVYADFEARAAQGESGAQKWLGRFTVLGERLGVHVPQS